MVLFKEDTGGVLDSSHEQLSRAGIYFKLIFRAVLAVVVRPMLKQLLSGRVTWSSVSLRSLEQGREWHELLSRGADTDSLH